MTVMPVLSIPSARAPDRSEADLIQRAALREEAAIREIIKQYNRRLYRLARSVVASNADAEDVLQEAYLHAFARIESFRGEASLATWLSRITLNAAFARLRSQRRQKRTAPSVRAGDMADIIPFPVSLSGEDPERTMAQRQLLRLVEQATDDLPGPFRVVFVARIIEGLSVEETAEVLGLPTGTVKTRLHRARKLVRDRLEAQIGPVMIDAFPFAGRRCDRLTEAVLAKLGFPK